MSNIIGEGFETFVSEQIKARQKILGNINKTNEEIIWENSKTSFVKLVSSADITDFTVFGGGFTEGKQLAEKYVLFNGVTDEIPTTNPGIENFQRSGIDTSGAYSNMGAYGLGGTQWGLQPMPGIISADIKSEAMGSLRTGTVQIKANNKGQFDIISTLYLRIGYTMLLEWGNTSYFDNGGNYITDNITSLADSFLSKKYNFGNIKEIFVKFTPKEKADIENKVRTKKEIVAEKTVPVTYNNLLQAVSVQQKYTNGNYDALIGRVVNYSWVFNRDGSYTITIILRSAGDVIESLKSNILLPGTVGVVGPTKSDEKFNLTNALSVGLPNDQSIIALANSSTIGQEFIKIQKLIPNTSATSFITNNDLTVNSNPFVTIYKPDKSNYIDYFSEKYNSGQTQYFIRFGTFLKLLEDVAIPIIQNGNEKIINFGNTDSDQILIYSPPRQISADPRICVFKKTLFNVYPNPPNDITLYSTLSDFIVNYGDNTYGKLMFCYFNMNFILKSIQDLNDGNGKVPIISLLNSILNGFCYATGNFNTITTKINYDTNTITFVDSTSLPDRNKILTSQGKNTTSAQFNVYGLETNTNGSIVGGSFIRDLQLKTEITPDLATLITIGSTAGGYVTGADAIAMSNLTKGTEDRIKPVIFSPRSTQQKSDEDNRNIEDTYTTALPSFNTFITETLTGTWNEDAFYNFSKTQNQLLEYDQKQNTKRIQDEIDPTDPEKKRKLHSYAASPNFGFLPFNLTLTMDGLSGMKIFNKYKIDARFLPENYPQSMEFVITNVSHAIQNNIWTTNITSIAIPLDPVGTKPGEKSKSLPTKTTQQGGEITTQEETNAYLIDLLKELGLPTTEGNILFFKAWRQFEAGSASWNAFNTMYDIGVTSNYNGLGVKNYSSRENGIQANAQTFKRKDYQPLLEKLKNVKTIQDAYNVAILESDGPKGGGLYIWSQGYYKERKRQCDEFDKPNHGTLTQKQIDNIVKYKGCPVLETVANTYVALTLKGWINSGFTNSSQATITNLIYKA